ncbi:MAG: SRPBCC family protein [Bacteroidota bacterium]
MPRIELTTLIQAPITVVFNLSRSVDLHKISAAHTSETVVPSPIINDMWARMTGLMEENETVTWRARHFLIIQYLTVKITSLHYPNEFTDEMVPDLGAFKAMAHRHLFEERDNATIMTDIFYYESPLGILGKLADVLFLKRYMRNFLQKRNTIIKAFAEDPAQWQLVPGL